MSGRVDAILVRRGPAELGRRRAGALRGRTKLAAAVLEPAGSLSEVGRSAAAAGRSGRGPPLGKRGQGDCRGLVEAVYRALQPAEWWTKMQKFAQIEPRHLLNVVRRRHPVQHAYGTIPNRSSGDRVSRRSPLVVPGWLWSMGFSDGRSAASASGRPSCSMLGRWAGWHAELMDGTDVAGWTLGTSATISGRAVQGNRAVDCCERPARKPRRAGTLADMQPCLEGAATPREAAYTILGLTRPDISVLPAPLQRLLDTLSDRLCKWYDEHRREGWLWFENSLTYDNGRLPQAMIAAGARLGKSEIKQRGLEALIGTPTSALWIATPSDWSAIAGVGPMIPHVRTLRRATSSRLTRRP